MYAPSRAGDNWLPGWGWYRARSHRAVRRVFWELVSAVIGIYARCSSWGPRSVLRQMKRDAAAVPRSWLGRLSARRHVHIAAVALANKNARIAWALLAHEREYRANYQSNRPVMAVS